MSLINRMLQDLDARAGQPGAAPLPTDIRAVPPPERSLPWKRVAVAAGAALALGALGLAGWRVLGQKPAPIVPQTAPAALSAPPVPPVLVAGPAAALAPAPVVAIEIPVPPRQDDASPAAAAVNADTPAAAEPSPRTQVRTQVRAPAPAAPAAKAVRPAARKVEKKQPEAAPTAPAKKDRAGAPKAVAGAPAAAASARSGRVETAAQRAENAYRRALASLEDGRVTEAMSQLEAALKADPRHEASRQTLVSLLIEAKRPDEAIRQLGAALALDPRQPAMAMLMARLQVERGSPGIDTLLRTLPYAAGNGDYHAFLAGMLAREGRHREAAEYYGVALRTAPQNGVWWMGLGLSLQAEKRNPEAAGAFRKALDSGSLSAELQGFVERKLKQLGR